MFGWLAHTLAAVCPHFHGSACPPRWLRVAPEDLAARLSLLGTVLYLPMPADGSPEHPARGWIAERAELAPLLHTRWLAACCLIGADGPREWVDCVDEAGRLRARLHLLPDTDYLAWDVLLSAGAPAAPPFRRVQRPFRAGGARPLHFTQRRIGVMDVLGGKDAARLSALGQSLAREVARAEALEPHRAA